MATITDNKDGTFLLNLTAIERDTLSGLPEGQLEGYLTIWLSDHAGTVIKQRFNRLGTAERDTIMATLKLTDPVKLEIVP